MDGRTQADLKSAYEDAIPSSSPAFATPIHPIRQRKAEQPSKPSILPIILPPATLRPLAFRTFTKKHNLTLNSSALQLFATFIGKYCGTGWREEGLAERVLDEAAKAWKVHGGAVIVPGEGDELKNILQNIQSSMAGGRLVQKEGLRRQGSFEIGELGSNVTPLYPREKSVNLHREDSLGMTALDIKDEDSQAKDPRKWFRIVGAFEQPQLIYNVDQKHFDTARPKPSLLSEPTQKTRLFRNRYNIIYQRLLRNESFQTSAVTTSRSGSLQRSSSTTATPQQSYKLTPIANLLGRSGSNHLLLGLLTISPTGLLTISDLTGSITLDIQHARPVPENGAWFAPGMIVLVDGMYEEESAAGLGLGGNGGIGGSIGGKFIGFSVGGPPCERREVTLGVGREGESDNLSAGGGFGWVDFLGVGSERALGPNMRRLEQSVLRRQPTTSTEVRSRMAVMGEVNLDSAKTLQALKKVLGTYAAEPADQSPIAVVLMGNFVRHAVMSGGGSGGSIEYKEYFDTLASALSEYPSILQTATFIFVPGDNDPWASSFAAGAATVLPRSSVPELFTTRIRRVFAVANTEAEKSTGQKTDGKAIWSTNPSRLTLFGPAQEVVFFRDEISGRLRRNAIRFRPLESASAAAEASGGPSATESAATTQERAVDEVMDVDQAVETAESNVPAPEAKEWPMAADNDLHSARKLVKTLLDQGYLSPFPLSLRPVHWDFAGALHLYPLPDALVLLDPETRPFAITYEGCHVMNPGSLVSTDVRGMADWIEYDVKTRRGKIRHTRY
ncbi:MAG: hypothetical protein Q9195_002781 [Heterodermia aff. obscurata]